MIVGDLFCTRVLSGEGEKEVCDSEQSRRIRDFQPY
jgi:hypothetical protein